MIIGIPEEISAEEKRLAISPVGVYAFTQKGHTVYVESRSGESCGFSDGDFKDVGAEIVFSHEEVFRRSDIIAKVQSPSVDECRFLSKNQVVFSLLNLGLAHKNAFLALQENVVTAIGYEMIERADGKRPVLTAMSEIAGCLLPQIAGRLLESQAGGRGILLASVAGIPAATVVILGAGVAGFHAARAFSKLGSNVIVLDKDVDRLRKIDNQLDKQVITSIVTPYNIERFTKIADVLIGAIFVYGEKTPHMVPEKLVSEMKKGSVIIDVSIDEGGCIETSRPTTLSDPTFVVHNVIHYCVPNIPASVARTASYALNNALVPLVMEMAENDPRTAIIQNESLKNGIYFYQGKCTRSSLSKYIGSEYQAIDEIL